jgi:hypothetical protein
MEICKLLNPVETEDFSWITKVNKRKMTYDHQKCASLSEDAIKILMMLNNKGVNKNKTMRCFEIVPISTEFPQDLAKKNELEESPRSVSDFSIRSILSTSDSEIPEVLQLPARKEHKSSKRRRVFHPCTVSGCDRAVQSRGVCKRHGGGVRCQESGCTKGAVSQGKCRSHGGGERCAVDGCTKWAQKKHWCVRHSHQFLD